MINYNDLMRVIRPFVNFKHDGRRDLNKILSASEKRRITKNYNIIRPLLARNNKVYKPRGKQSKKRLRTAQTFGQHSKFSKDINVALIPTDGEKTTKVIVRGDTVIIKSRGVTQTQLLFDQQRLAADPIAHTSELVATVDSERFHILCGEFQIARSYGRNQIGRAVNRLAQRYQQGGSEYAAVLNADGSIKYDNHFNNWMIGLQASDFTDQEEFDEFSEKRFPKRKTRRRRKKKKTKKKKTRRKKK